jgi:hypothetical protein
MARDLFRPDPNLRPLPQRPAGLVDWPFADSFFPLVCQATAAQGQEDRPAYQRCRTGTRYWRGWAHEFRGEWCVYVHVYGPRGTLRGWAAYSPDEAYRLAGEIKAAAEAVTEDWPAVRAPWSARVKGEEEIFTLTYREAWRLGTGLYHLALRAELKAVAAERDALAARVAELEMRLGLGKLGLRVLPAAEVMA